MHNSPPINKKGKFPELKLGENPKSNEATFYPEDYEVDARGNFLP